MISRRIKSFFDTEAAGSIVLLAAAALAMFAANSPLQPYYSFLRQHTVEVFINDGLMAFFFLVVGIEIRKDMTEGELSLPGQLMLPVCAAAGGVLLPAALYAWLNWGSVQLRGWAIPSATDIAFSMGVLALLGRRVPTSLRMFLMSVAVIDDIAAVVIIAIFYTSNLSLPGLLMSLLCTAILYAYGKRGVTRAAPYFFAAIALWLAMFESGIHASLSGVVVGMLLPLPLGKHILNVLHPWVAFGIIPLFAFANAGVPLSGVDVSALAEPVPLGIILGLFAGKQLGIFLVAWALVRKGIALRPKGASWGQFYGVCMLAGIGFTMSLFIGSLAFNDENTMMGVRIGVLVGSFASAIGGAACLLFFGSSRKGAA